ncbi:MAG: hypothetical protein MRY21_04615 [Simkaniaceae bacterium]|nr:hypothetical protein [Simkaniaceae bacterium]
MKGHIPALLTVAAIAVSACNNSGPSRDKEIISKRYIHRYGYDVSPNEWDQKEFPGKVVTTQRDGATIVQNFEAGILHGPTTETYSHSHTIKIRKIYDKGVLTKQTHFDVSGLPEREELFTSPMTKKVTAWFRSGTPRYVEEYANDTLVAGQYFNATNDVESQIDSGFGERTIRNREGELVGKEVFERSNMISKETFYANGNPREIVSYKNGVFHGEKSEYDLHGAPLYKENWRAGKLHGTRSLYQNGIVYAEVPYVNGQKHGTERRYIDGHILSEESEWVENKRHGASIAYCDGMTRTEYFFNNDKVSKAKYHELLEREQQIATLSERGQRAQSFDFTNVE